MFRIGFIGPGIMGSPMDANLLPDSPQVEEVASGPFGIIEGPVGPA
jgi:3-hydroxyisobutyrate dehydrogenase-like beta-hydroxyacid dehydrogenase